MRRLWKLSKTEPINEIAPIPEPQSPSAWAVRVAGAIDSIRPPDSKLVLEGGPSLPAPVFDIMSSGEVSCYPPCTRPRLVFPPECIFPAWDGPPMRARAELKREGRSRGLMAWGGFIFAVGGLERGGSSERHSGDCHRISTTSPR